MITRADLRSALANPNVHAFLAVIRHGEGTYSNYGYRTLFGGEFFDDYRWHPERKVTRTVGGKPLTSTAAGAYQILAKTWEGLVNRYGFEDFSPERQDEAAVALIAIRHALQDVIDGRFGVAIDKCALEWASLPGSPYGQPTITMERALDLYVKYGGLCQAAVEERPIPEVPIPEVPIPEVPIPEVPIPEVPIPEVPIPEVPIPEVPIITQPPAPVEERIIPPEVKPMTPFLPIALEAITAAVPALASIFTDKGKTVPERNLAAAVRVVESVKTAVGAANEQDLVEKLQNDPAAAAQAKQAVQTIWFEITGTPETIQAAREADAAFVARTAPLRSSPAFIISLVLMSLVFMLAADVFFVHAEKYTGDLRTQIVTALLLIIGMVAQYWIGTSYSSSRKTDAMLGNKPTA